MSLLATLQGSVVANDIVRTELIQISSRLITWTAAKSDSRSLIVRVEMFSVNSVTLAFCKLLFCHDSLENVANIDAFKVPAVPLPAAK